MPTPRDDETQDEFIARCIPIVLEDGTAEDNEQAVAVCMSMWEDRNKDAKGVRDREMNKTQVQAQEHKTLPLIVTKIEGDQGIVEHTVAVMGNVDLGGDRIHPGAFTKTITERMGRIRVLDTHNSGSVLNVVGKPLSLWEVGKEQLAPEVVRQFPDATGALMARTQFLMDTPEGAGVFARIKAGAVNEYSIGYDVLDVDYTEEEIEGKSQPVRNLHTIRLWEYSPVTFAMNPATSTVSAKTRRAEADSVLDPRRFQEETSKSGRFESNDDKVASGSTTLPIADRDRAWDSAAAVAGIRRLTDSEEEPSARYKNGFFWYDSSEPDTFGSYKLPFAADVGGTLTAIPRGIFAVAATLQGSRGGVDIPEGDVSGVRSRVERYYARMRSQFDDDSIVPPWEKANVHPVEDKSYNLGSRIGQIVQSFYSAYPDSEEHVYWVDEVWNDYLVVDMETRQGSAYWRVPYAMVGDEERQAPVFASPEQWMQIEQVWIPVTEGLQKSAKVGRTFSAANLGRIQSAIDAVQAALADLEEMIAGAMPQDEGEAPPEEEAALDSQQEQKAGPVEPPTLDREQALADIEQYIKEIQRELLEETQ